MDRFIASMPVWMAIVVEFKIAYRLNVHGIELNTLINYKRRGRIQGRPKIHSSCFV
jgi:hypothetical protein